jgi:hypothetical protein
MRPNGHGVSGYPLPGPARRAAPLLVTAPELRLIRVRDGQHPGPAAGPAAHGAHVWPGLVAAALGEGVGDRVHPDTGSLRHGFLTTRPTCRSAKRLRPRSRRRPRRGERPGTRRAARRRRSHRRRTHAQPPQPAGPAEGRSARPVSRRFTAAGLIGPAPSSGRPCPPRSKAPPATVPPEGLPVSPCPDRVKGRSGAA